MTFSRIKSSKVYQWIRTLRFFYLYELFFNLRKIFRKIFKSKEYRKLRKLQNIHKNERCFIIATGPSMKMSDLKKLNKEVTFGMNSLCRAFDETGWETTYFAIQDKSVYKKMYEDLGKLTTTKLFVSDDNSDVSQIKCELFRYPLNIYNHKTVSKKFIYKYSDSICDEISAGFSITYSIIQIATYMGFKEIYLLGCDCNYVDDKNKRHFIETGHYDPTYRTIGDKMIEAYKVAKKNADANNVKIYNSTRGGKLEVFERIDLDSVLGLNHEKDNV